MADLLELVQDFPESPGVYYFNDKSGIPIYIGKSIRIKSRVLEHIKNTSPGKDLQICHLTETITFEETGNELCALLLESSEIKLHQPKYNKAQKLIKLPWGIYTELNPDGYRLFSVKKNPQDMKDLVREFKNEKSASGYLYDQTEKLKLCQGFNGFHSCSSPCMKHQMKLCNGATLGQESSADYNLRATELITGEKLPYESFLLIESGRNEAEKAVIYVKSEGARYNYLKNNDIESINETENESFRAFLAGTDAQKIILNYLKKTKDIHMIILEPR